MPTDHVLLADDTLGTLPLGGNDFVVVQVQIGAPAVRAVMYDRALADGSIDDTRFTGARAYTLSITLNDANCTDTTMQSLVDRLAPYMAPRRRPVLSWSLPGTPGLRRQATVRGEGLPIVVRRRNHNQVICSFVGADGRILSEGGQVCETINPSEDVEDGRTYDLIFDRVYPPSQGIGDRLVHVAGNERAHWVGTLYAEADQPTLRVNGIDIAFTQNGGLDLAPGQTVVIDTLERTILLNGDPEEPRYHLVNFTQWQWDDLLLDPGENRLRYTAAVLGPGAQAVICWTPTWAS